MARTADVDRHPEAAASFDRHPHPEEPAKRASRRIRVTAQDEGGPRRMIGPVRAVALRGSLRERLRVTGMSQRSMPLVYDRSRDGRTGGPDGGAGGGGRNP